MIQTIDLKKGMVFEKDGKLLKVLAINHHKPGKGNTLMQMDIQDVRSGSIVHTTMRPSEKVEQVMVNKKNAQYLYDEGNTSVFMDLETYEQYEIDQSQINEEKKYLTENMQVQMNFVDSELVGIELPATVTLEVVETQPEIKGATIDGGGKPATMNTGLVVTVPSFVKNGDKIIVNTSDGAYKSRA
ncbi:elongation factor P [Limosilactobacillus fermentum]|uniref:elongation factor P n=1 Tax=Limosilactobacillus fermentum TaxID=1613 RepID=UPI0021A4EF89|nr:elongation factor P [Limosilactobacillus fermentum]MCT3450038.1 elongation factor P [Limosilactobacillus fermentum]MCT3454346.1 elongation factor P [Limosilactobacillus fermentum]MCT3458237.1 elongation factor P [Limosilactobacillus fermentum]